MRRVLLLVAAAGCGTPTVSMDAVSEAAAEASITDAFPEAAPEAAVCPDEDNDGHRARACGGDDCNDSDPAIAPGLPPRCSMLDFNCNGSPDATEGASQDSLDRWCRTNVRSTDYLSWSHPPRCVRDGTLPFPYRSQIVRCMACSETPRMPGMYGCACWSDRTGEQQCSP